MLLLLSSECRKLAVLRADDLEELLLLLCRDSVVLLCDSYDVPKVAFQSRREAVGGLPIRSGCWVADKLTVKLCDFA